MSRVDAEEQRVCQQLQAREPLFHHWGVVGSDADFEREVAPDFWEVGASGRIYQRDFVKQVVLQRLVAQDQDESVREGWHTTDEAVRRLAEDLFLFTYTLHGQGRVTRRSTIWRRQTGGWQALYHQGTVVQDDG